MLATGLGLGAVPFQVLLVHTVPHLVDLGYSAALAALVLGLSGACTIAANLLLGWAADRLGGEWAYTLGSVALVAGIGLLLALGPRQEVLLYVYVALFAVGFASRNGGLVGYLGAALAQGPSLGAVMGVISTHLAVYGALGLALTGWLYDRTGSYQLPFALAMTCGALATGCIWLAAPRRGSLVAGERLG
jgi:predicted MFS family arabinose efflux permease